MNCTIKFENASATIFNWSNDCEEIINLALQLLPEEKLSRRHVTTLLRGFNLANYFQQNGIEVKIEIADPAEHARLTVWNEKLRTIRSDISTEDVNSFIKDMGLTYRQLQERGIKKILQSYFAILAAGCGNGKTLMNLSVVQFAKNKRGKALCIIVLPTACASEYSKELSRFRGYFDLTLLNTCGMSSKQAKDRIETNDCDIVVISVDSISPLLTSIKGLLQNFNGEAILIIEEGHAVKNTLSKRSTAVQSIAPLFDRVIISTATPLPLGPKDLRGYIATVGIPQPEDLYSNGIPSRDFDFLKGVAFVTDEEDVPFAPLINENIEYTDLDDLNRRIREEVSSELEKNRKVVIFTSTNAALVTAYDLFKGIGRTVLSGSYGVSNINGDELIAGRNCELQAQAIDQFNNDPSCKILIANYRVGSTGLNLQYSQARMAIFYEITSSGADFFQSKYRIRRPTVFPAEGFKYIYAVPTDPQQRRRVNRQFIKLADQQNILRQIKALSGRSA